MTLLNVEIRVITISSAPGGRLLSQGFSLEWMIPSGIKLRSGYPSLWFRSLGCKISHPQYCCGKHKGTEHFDPLRKASIRGQIMGLGL